MLSQYSFFPHSRWPVGPYAPFCWSRCHHLNGSSDRRTQVLCSHTLQPASALHLWWAGAPHAPQLPLQQCTPGLPPTPSVHEQEEGECEVKGHNQFIIRLDFPVICWCGSTYRLTTFPLFRSCDQLNTQTLGVQVGAELHRSIYTC